MEYTDQLSRTISIPNKPMRIISLVPSQTELLYDLGLGERLVGITKFCPKQGKSKVIGGTKIFNHDMVTELKPDLIIGNKEENSKEDIEKLMEQYPVWMSDVKSMEDAVLLILALGKITDTNDRAKEMVDQIHRKFQVLSLSSRSNKTVAYLIWQKPLMVAAGDTYINEMLKWAGYQNIFADQKRYPIVRQSEITRLNPDLIFLSSEPFPFKEKHLAEIQTIYPDSVVKLVDGKFFSWYGSSLLDAPAYFHSLQTEIT